MVYLHGCDDCQHQIADTLSKLARDELKRGSKRQDGQATGNRSEATGTKPERAS
jgi:hypothetical protein